MQVVLVEDHHLVREGLFRLLDEMDIVDAVCSLASGEEAMRYLHGKHADVVIVDADMPGMAGLDVSRRMLKANRHLAVILMVDDPNAVVPSRLIRTGALGFITKGSKLDDLAEALISVHAGRRYIASDLANAMAMSMFHETEDSPLTLLSDREMQILIKVSQGQTNLEISTELCLSPKTVSTYRYRLYEKLDVRNDVDLTHLAIQQGLVKLKTLPS